MRHYPFLNPHISAQSASQQAPAYQDKTTAQQQFNKIVDEVMLKKNREKLNNPASEATGGPKCKMHPVKPSKMCRQCKAIEADKHMVGEQQPPIQAPIHHAPAHDTDHFILNCDTPLSHINEKLKKNVQGSDYFKALYSLKTFQEVLNQIQNQCHTVQTFQKGSSQVPTKFICLFYKFLLMRLTAKQVKALIESDNCYVKAMGLLYTRLLCSYEQVFDWLSPHLLNPQQFFPTIDNSEQITVGEYVQRLLLELSHYQLRLPRIPLKLDKEYQERIKRLKEDKRQEKAKEQKAIHKQKAQIQASKPDKIQPGIVAVVMFNGKKERLKVSELATDKVLVYHPVTGEIISFQYDEVDLEDAGQAPQNPPKNKVQRKRKASRSSNSSSSLSSDRSRSRSNRKRRHNDRKDKKSKSRRDRHRKRYSSSSSSRSASRQKRRRRRSPSSASRSKTPPRERLAPPAPVAKPKPKEVLIPQIVPSKSGLTDTRPTSSLESLKANIKSLAATQNPQPAPLPPAQPKINIENVRSKYEAEVEREAWEDPVLKKDQEEEVLRLG